jgi:hypothetical protein
MMAPIGKTNLLQPCCSFLHREPVGNSSHKKRHSNVLLCRELRHQIVELPDKPDFSVAKIGCGIFIQLSRLNLRAVYVTFRTTIKSSEDVQKTAFPRSGLAYNGEHFPLPHLEGQIVKEH